MSPIPLEAPSPAPGAASRPRTHAARSRRAAPALALAVVLGSSLLGTAPAAFASAAGTLEGSVLTPSGEALPDVNIDASVVDCPQDETCFDTSGQTDASGRFSLCDDVVDGATYSLDVQGYTPDGDWLSIAYPAGQPQLANRPVQAVAGGDDTEILALASQPTLSGLVKDSTGAVAGGNVLAFHADAELPSPGEEDYSESVADFASINDDPDSGELGRYTFTNLIPGERYRLFFANATVSLNANQWAGGSDAASATLFTADAASSANLTVQRIADTEANFPSPVLPAEVTPADPVSVDLSAWKLRPSDVKYLWSVGGKQQPGSYDSEFWPNESDNGKTLKVTVVATLSDGTRMQRSSNTTTITVPVEMDAHVWVEGDEEVGSTLSVHSEINAPESGATITYQWGWEDDTAEFVDFPGATGDSFALLPEHEGKIIAVKVRITAPGYYEWNNYFGSDPISPASVAFPDPELRGNPVVGNTLRAEIDTTGLEDVTFTYQWTRDFDPIDGATGATYELTQDDANTLVSVEVTGSKPGLADRMKTAPVAYVSEAEEGASVEPADIDVTGEAKVGSTVTVNAHQDQWVPATAELSYHWSVDGVTVSTDPSYTIEPGDAGKDLEVQVIGTAADLSAGSTSVGLGRVALGELTAPQVTFPAQARVGQAFRAAVDTSANVSVSYAWLRNGVAIADATSASYTPQASDAGEKLSASLTYTRPGYAPLTVTDQGTTTVGRGTLQASVPQLLGTARLGSPLFAERGEWGPDSPAYAYQWFRGTDKIDGATAVLYTPVAADLGKTLSVQVTGTLPGYEATTKASSASAAVAGLELVSSTPEIAGTAQVNQTLTARPGTWGPGAVVLSYQWLANGQPIAKATGTSYKLAVADLGKKISVRVTGTQPGYTTQVKTSTQTGATAAAILTAPAPTVTGVAAVGNTLSGKAGTWTAGAKLSYQWKRNGAAIAKATGTSYVLTATDKGAKITLDVTGALPGYATRTVGSKALTIAPGTITAPAATISGTAKVGSTLTVKAGTWKPSGVALKYQWKANGKNITGATKASFKPTTKQKKAKITVTVTGTKAGYATKAVTSASTKAVV